MYVYVYPPTSLIRAYLNKIHGCHFDGPVLAKLHL